MDRVEAVAAASRQAPASPRTVPPRTVQSRETPTTESTDVAAVAEPAADETEAAANGAVTEKPKPEQSKAPGRRRTTRIHVPGDPDAPAVAPEVLQEAIAEPQVEAVERPSRRTPTSPSRGRFDARGRCQRSRAP